MAPQPDADFAPVRKLAAAGRWREAREKYTRILRKAGRDWRPYYHAGMLEASGGDFARAERALAKARSLAPGEPLVAVNLAQVLMHLNRIGDALGLLDPIARELAGNPAVQKLYGGLLLQAGRIEEAATALESCLGAGEDPITLNNLGIIYRSGADLPKAADFFARAVKAGGGIEAASNLGSAYLAAGRFEEARGLFEDVEKRGALDPRVQQAAGTYRRDTGDISGAIRSARRGVLAQPGHVPAYSFLAELHDRNSDIEEALATAIRGLALVPGEQLLEAIRGRALRRAKRLDEAEAVLRTAATAEAGPDSYRIGFEMAQVLESQGKREEAFGWFEKANRLQLEHAKNGLVDPARAFAEVEGLRKAFAAKPVWRKPEAAAADQADPVFLVGFPRSGTTLLDQVLDAHPAIEVLEERPMVTGLVTRLAGAGIAYPSDLSAMSEAQVQEFREAYFSDRDRFLVPKPGSIFIDKMPLNIVHAGLILRIFPNARFILALRHPCDVCLSCLMQNFGLNHWMATFCSLPDTVRLYREVFGLWQQYVETLDPAFVSVRYEDMTRDLRGAAGPVLRFLGLDWQEGLEHFHEHARTRGHIATPSYAQVTQPLYRHAVARWKRYDFVMDKVAAELAAEIERFGYGD